MARFPDGWVFTVDPKRTGVIINRSELVMCKHCWKRGLDNCPMEFYFDCHPAEDDCFCKYGELPPNVRISSGELAQMEREAGT